MEVTWGVAIGATQPSMAEDQQRRAAELQLVRAAQGGDLLAFERLYRDNERKVFGLCFRLSSDPALINSAATGDGWLWKMKLANKSQLEGLMDEAGYKAHIG